MCSANNIAFTKHVLFSRGKRKRMGEGEEAGGGGGGAKIHKDFLLKYSLQFILDLRSEYRE